MEHRHALYLKAKAISALCDESLDTAAREAWLVQVCEGDEALAEEVRWQLVAVSEDVLNLTGDSVIRSPRQSTPTPDHSGETVQAERASGYRLRRRIGSGGMGVVYLAERDVGGANQVVALKLLGRDDALDASRLRHFESECRILAGLSHPNISRLLDAGRFDDGRPFLAMEFVDGERIDRWCARQKLTLEARLRLFLKVCAAVFHAHACLVIHRDIKPANILVDAQGEPKLLDFGIARLVDGEGASVATQTAAPAMTWAYASPEQLRNETLGTRSDVWQLGLLLYELLAGQHPLSERHSPLRWTEIVTTDALPRPSRSVMAAPMAGVPRIPADVDAIVMKALRASPDERYGGVGELMADVERYLDARPVEAMRGQHWYRLRRSLWRQRRPLLALGVVLALSLGFAMDRQSTLKRVEQERDKAQALLAFSRELFENADPTRTRGQRLTVVEMLDHGANNALADSSLAPEVKAAMLVSIAHSYNALDLADRALPLLEQGVKLLGDEADPAELGMAWAALGRAQSILLNLPASIAAGERALTYFKLAKGDQRHRILRTRINTLYGHAHLRDMAPGELAREVESALAALAQHPEPELRVQAMAVLAMARAMEGNAAAAIEVADQALAEAQTLYTAQDPALIYYRFIAALMRMRTDPATALVALREQVKDYEHILGEMTLGGGMLLSYQGQALRSLGAYDDALLAYQQAEQVLANYVSTAPDAYISIQAQLAREYLRDEQRDKAQGLLEHNLALGRERAAAGGGMAVQGYAGSLEMLAELAWQREDLAVATRHLEALSELGERFPVFVSLDLRTHALTGQARAAITHGEWAQAEALHAGVQQQLAAAGDAMTPSAQLDAHLLDVQIAVSRQADDRRTRVEAVLAAMPADLPACSRQGRWLRTLALVESLDGPAACDSMSSSRITP